MEEQKAEIKHDKGHDGLSRVKTPISEIEDTHPSPETFSLGDSAILDTDPLSCNPLPSQQGTSEHSTIAWDTSQMEDLCQSSSDIDHFSIAHETFPDAENVSYNCSDGSQDVQEVEELLLPPVMSCSPDVETTRQMIRRHLDESPFAERFKETESDFVPSALTTTPVLGTCSGEQVFSLGLDQLESFSSPLREELTLPNLITFSPMDEL